MFCDLRPENIIFPQASLAFIFLQPTFLVLVDRILPDALLFVLVLLIILTFLCVCDSFNVWWLEFIRHKCIAAGGPLE